MKSKLRERRKALNLRMIDIALKSGVGVSTIWLIENGYSRRVTLQTKRKISTALGANIKELF